MLSIGAGIFTIISKNPIISVIFLITLFLCISGYLIILGINFIGISYLIVYVGAVSILFLFILMLINIRISELLTNTNNSIPLAMLIGLFFNVPLYEILSYNIKMPHLYNLSNFLYNIIYNNNNEYLSKLLSDNFEDLSFVSSKL
jgi:NADH-ubiquinone oxidoreductase chain 6